MMQSSEGGVAHVGILCDWKPGTGRYHSNDRSTYFVTNNAGGIVVVLAVGGTVGRGNTTRTIVQRGNRLIVETRYRSDGSEPLPEIVLEPDMQGWWELSGAEVFTAIEPQITEARPTEERRSRSAYARATAGADERPEMQTGVADVQPLSRTDSVQPELPPLGQRVVDRLLCDYTVRSGPGGIVLLFAADTVIVPDESPGIFDDYLQSDYRFAFLRALRNSPLTMPLEEVPYLRFPKTGFVQDGQRGDRAAGWYWRTDVEDTFICPRNDGLRINLGMQSRSAWPMAINNSLATPQAVVGVVTGADYVYPRARSGSDFELLVHCTRGGSREFTILMLTAEGTHAGHRQGLSLVSYRLTHTTNGGLFMNVEKRDSHKPPYVVAFDTKRRPRIFRKP